MSKVLERINKMNVVERRIKETFDLKGTYGDGFKINIFTVTLKSFQNCSDDDFRHLENFASRNGIKFDYSNKAIIIANGEEIDIYPRNLVALRFEDLYNVS